MRYGISTIKYCKCKVGKSESWYAALHQGSSPIRNPLLREEPVENVTVVFKDMAKFGYGPNRRAAEYKIRSKHF